MKNIYSFLVLFLISILLLGSDITAQSFYTGAIGVTQSNGGRTRVFSNNLTTRELERVSLLVGVSSEAVFDYNQDQDVQVPAATVTSPLLSDFEVTSTINNSYSNLPPNVSASLNIYGWNNEAYIVVKTVVTNNETSAINAVLGLEVLPRIDGTYDQDTLQWDASSQTFLINQSKFVGIKFFYGVQTSLKLIPWVSGYGTDAFFYSALTQNSFDAPLENSTVDGTVAVMGQAPVTIQPGATADFYYGIAIGSNKATCLTNMSAAENKFNTTVPVELTSFTAVSNGNKVTLNWSTATETNNQGFEIQRNQNGNWTSIAFKNGAGTTTNAQSYSFVDDLISVKHGKVSYRLKQIDFNGASKYSQVVEVELNSMPLSYSLDQNYPNPFNPSTKISYQLPQSGFVSLKVYNAIGKEVATLVNEEKSAGNYEINFSANGLSSGIYFYTIQSGSFTQTKKMILMK
ncbi:MAG TPA: T9SS type A sorting domain-containing protein [Ignavibacteriaceae bacterium]|nr:T9SS type A sorting domain-containing protein [Ignavibacteriaceae bacterium]